MVRPSPFDKLGDDPKKSKKDETNFSPPAKLSGQEKESLNLVIEGLGVNEIARKIGRSSATVSRATRKLRDTGALALVKAGKLLEGKLNALQTLQKIHKKAWSHKKPCSFPRPRCSASKWPTSGARGEQPLGPEF